MAVKTPVHNVLDALMAGCSAAEVQPWIDQLSPAERSDLLCAACSRSEGVHTNRTAELKQVLLNNSDAFRLAACSEPCKAKIHV